MSTIFNPSALPAKTDSARGAIYAASFVPKVSALAADHQDFDNLALELESDPSLREELASAGSWVADRFYAGETDTFKTARLRKGYSQAQLGKLIGTSQPHIANLERGESDFMFSTGEKLCDALGISMSDLRSMLERQRNLNSARRR